MKSFGRLALLLCGASILCGATNSSKLDTCGFLTAKDSDRYKQRYGNFAPEESEAPDWCSQSNTPFPLQQEYGSMWQCMVQPSDCRTDGKTTSEPLDWATLCDASEPTMPCQYTAGGDLFDTHGYSMMAFQVSSRALAHFRASSNRLVTPVQVVDFSTPTSTETREIWVEPINQPAWLGEVIMDTWAKYPPSSQFFSVLQLPPPAQLNFTRSERFEDFNASYGEQLDSLWARSQLCTPSHNRTFSPGDNRVRSWFGLEQWIDPSHPPGALIAFGNPEYFVLSVFERASYNQSFSSLECVSEQTDWSTSEPRDCDESGSACCGCHWPWRVLNTSRGQPAAVKAKDLGDGAHFLSLSLAPSSSAGTRTTVFVLVRIDAGTADDGYDLWEFQIQDLGRERRGYRRLVVDAGNRLDGMPQYTKRLIRGTPNGPFRLNAVLRRCFGGERESLLVSLYDHNQVHIFSQADYVIQFLNTSSTLALDTSTLEGAPSIHGFATMSVNPPFWNQQCEDVVLGLPMMHGRSHWLGVTHLQSPNCSRTAFDTYQGCPLTQNWSWASPAQTHEGMGVPLILDTVWQKQPTQIDQGSDSSDRSGSSGSEGRLFFHSHHADKAAHVWAIVPKSKAALPGEEFNEVPHHYEVTKINELYFMGETNWMGVSPNSQQLVVMINRTLAELQSMDRLVTMCEITWGEEHYKWLTDRYNRSELMIDDDAIKELELEFTKVCNPTDTSKIPARPGLFAFVQLATSCETGVSCPTTSQAKWAQDQPGNYAVMTISRQPCPLGSFCPGGVKTECPAGFVCGELGMRKPKRCRPTAGYTCYSNHTGLTTPRVCPRGQTCSVPYLPPIPVGPGLYDARAEGEDTPARIERCPLGSYCNLGCSTEKMDTDCRCPKDATCPNASVELPWPCVGKYVGHDLWECDADGRKKNPPICELGPSCPKGTYAEFPLCPAGSYCKQPDERVNCTSGYYCPEGTLIEEECPRGYYCPTPALKLVCPARHYCLLQSVQPVACNLMEICPTGSSSTFDLVPFVLGAILAATIFSVRKWFKCVRDSARSQIDSSILERHASEFELSSSMEESEGLTSIVLDNASQMQKPDPGSPEQPKSLSGRIRSVQESIHVLDRTRDHILRNDAPETYVPLSAQQGNFLNELGSAAIDISFKHLTLTVKSPHKVVLQGVDGQMRAGRTFAIMGPSGAGKTSLLAGLAGKASYAHLSGEIRVNGQVSELHKYKKLTGFVPQEDIMHRRLTPHENIMMSACLRLPAELSHQTRIRIVNSVIETLGLTMIRHNQIGDEDQRGISGGQRKRVNIAMEMVALPRILFLDEPTSGLDSSSSREVCRCMEQIASSSQVLVATVLHQPRYEIFQAIDDVMFLCSGRVVFCGPTGLALEYFGMHGYTVPHHVNPADFYMDIIAGEAKPMATPEQLVSRWQQAANGEFGRTRLNQEPLCDIAVNPHRTTEGVLPQTILYLRQALVQQKREFLYIALDMVLLLIGGCFLAAAFADHDDYEYKAPLPENVYTQCPGKLQDKCKAPTQDKLPTICSMVCLVMALTGSVASLRTFGAVKLQFYRDRARGSSVLAFYLARTLAHLPNILLWPYVFLLPFYSIAGPQGSYGDWYGILLAMQLTSAGWGYLVSVLVPEKLSYLGVVVVMLSQTIFSGANPTLPMIKSSMPWATWLTDLIFLRWGQEALYIIQVEGTIHADPGARERIEDSMDEILGYDRRNLTLDIILVLVIGVGVRVAACVALTFYQRDKQRQV